MKKKIHINQHKIRRNAKTGEREPVITVTTFHCGRARSGCCNEIIIDSPCKVIYSPDKPSGWEVCIETEGNIICS